MFRLIKIELAKAYYSRYIWIGLACCLALVIGFGALLNADDLFESTNAEHFLGRINLNDLFAVAKEICRYLKGRE